MELRVTRGWDEATEKKEHSWGGKSQGVKDWLGTLGNQGCLEFPEVV